MKDRIYSFTRVQRLVNHGSQSSGLVRVTLFDQVGGTIFEKVFDVTALATYYISESSSGTLVLGS